MTAIKKPALSLRLGLVCDTADTQSRFVEMLGDLGCAPQVSRLVDDAHCDEGEGLDAWVIHVSTDDDWPLEFEHWLAGVSVPVLLAEDLIPGHKLQAYSDWKHRWYRKLLKLTLGREELVSWPKQLWFVAASAGGPEAALEFFESLEPDLDVGFVYIQHTTAAAETSLVKILNKRSTYPLVLGKAGTAIGPGKVVVISAKHSVHLSSRGVLETSAEPWASDFAPSIDQFVCSAIHKLGNRCQSSLGLLILSGMGEDGAAACQYSHQSAITIWAQGPKSCISPYMPQAAIETGFVANTGSPQALAGQLASLLADGDKTPKGSESCLEFGSSKNVIVDGQLVAESARV